MHMTVEPLTAERLPEVEHLWPHRAVFTSHQFAAATRAAAALLRDARAQGAIVRENGTPRAVGLTVFVREDFADNFYDRPFPHVGRHLLLHADGPCQPVLTVQAIGRRNAGAGLQMF